MCSRFRRIAACAFAALVLAGPAAALPGDKDQPIQIEADEALRDENQGFTRYEGNVKLDQGSLHIEADRLTVYHTGDDAKKIVAVGHPATMRQRPEADKEIVHARANTIEYFRDEERVQLLDNASIEQEGSSVTGDVIDYFIREKLVKAGSDKGDDSRRVVVVIEAQAVQEMNGDNKPRAQSRDPNNPAAPAPAEIRDPNSPAAMAAPEARDPNNPAAPAAAGGTGGESPVAAPAEGPNNPGIPAAEAPAGASTAAEGGDGTADSQ